MALAYTAPTWTDGSGEGISASNLQAISNCIEGLVQGSDKAVHGIQINGSVITLTYADGTSENFTAVDIKGISSITKTSTSGLVDTYTILYSDGTTSTFTVTNGADGVIAGGTTGQVLKKHSDEDYDVEWADESGGGSSYTAGDGIDITNNVISVDEMPSADMSDVVYPLPTSLQPITNPVGCIITMMGIDAPSGYLKCDGTVYNIADYQNLADYFLDQFNASNYFGGDGSTTFAVPDLRGEFLRMTGTNSHANQGDGASVGVHQDATEIPWIATNGSGASLNARKYNNSDGNSPAYMDKSLRSSKGMSQVNASYNSGASSASEGERYTTRPTNTSVLYCIKF